MATINQTLAKAAGELGNRGGKYWQYFGYSYTDATAPAWCCVFICWLFAAIGMGFTFAMNCLTIQAAMLAAGFVKVSKDDIRAGDVVIFEWDRAGDTYDHIGIVELVLSPSAVQCLEGNCSGKVARRSRYLADIRLVFRPPYAGAINGWVKENGIWYYYKENTKATDQWIKGANGADWYYVGSDGAMYADTWLKYKGAWYHFGADGAMETDAWAEGEGAYAGKWFYLGADGKPVKNKAVNWNGDTYYLGEDGAAVANKGVWKDGKCYFFGADGALVKHGGGYFSTDASGAIDNLWD